MAREHSVTLQDSMALQDSKITSRVQRMAQQDSDIEIHTLTQADMSGATAVLNEGFGSKMCCCCVPGTESVSDVSKRYTKAPAKLSVSAVAKRGGVVVGVLLMAEYGMPVYPPFLVIPFPGIPYTNKPGEMYIEQVAVSAVVRGQGVGGKLLDWAESTARDRGATLLSLAVLNGNPAIRLYEKKGFVAQRDCADECCGAIFVCFVMGRPYGICSPHVGGVDMHKPLS